MTAHNPPGARDPLVDRAEVVKVLQHAGMDPGGIDAALDGLQFRDHLSHLAGKLEDLGITRERLMDRMGTGP